MPLGPNEPVATEADGSTNPDYCGYCYKDGAFTTDVTMDQMIDFCVPIVVEQVPGVTAEAARAQMAQVFPTLKRWRA